MSYIEKIHEFFEPCDTYTCSVVRIKEILELFGGMGYRPKDDIIKILNNYGYNHNSNERFKLKKKKEVIRNKLPRDALNRLQRKYLLKN
jgi:hypothetical protein